MRTRISRTVVSCILLSLPSAALAVDPPPVTPAPRSEDWWQGMHERFCGQAKRGGIDVLFLGDSITARFASGAGAALWRDHCVPLKAANFGIEGDRVENVLWRVRNGELDGIRPRVVVLLVGTNNSWGQPNVDDRTRGRYIASGVASIVETIRTKTPGANIVLMAVFPTGGGLPPCLQVANEAIATLAVGKDIRFLDIGAEMTGADGKVPKEILPDGLHPSEKGYAIWMARLKPLLGKE